ncbi:MAG: AAA family ATPase [Gammaproteobacteria bacterium]|nr:AAA family ATPase [Gammaproteobacteria bacterium]
MSVPVLTFLNNKGGVGKTSLVYHLAWMLPEIGERVLVCDLDPQANLTASFLSEDELESLWDDPASNRTVFQCVAPLIKVGDIHEPCVYQAADALGLIPGDLALSGFEDNLSSEWPNALEESNLYRPFRILSAFWQIMQAGAKEMEASIILADVGPNLGALNRSALIATDHVVVPLGADLFSLQGLHNLGPTLARWRREWSKRRANWQEPDFELPKGAMSPIGYIVQQHGVQLGRPVKAYDKWVNRMPEAYASRLMDEKKGPFAQTPAHDKLCIATVKHYRSLVPMAQEARKPIFELTSADGAIGAHAAAVREAYKDFRKLAKSISERVTAAA